MSGSPSPSAGPGVPLTRTPGQPGSCSSSKSASGCVNSPAQSAASCVGTPVKQRQDHTEMPDQYRLALRREESDLATDRRLTCTSPSRGFTRRDHARSASASFREAVRDPARVIAGRGQDGGMEVQGSAGGRFGPVRECFAGILQSGPAGGEFILGRGCCLAFSRRGGLQPPPRGRAVVWPPMLLEAPKRVRVMAVVLLAGRAGEGQPAVPPRAPGRGRWGCLWAARRAHRGCWWRVVR
jgi:hypothetical protein